jgi:galactose mutarotase-like enzyme
LWSDGGPFLCIEPCWGLTDHHQQRAFENKEGIQTIAPGGVLHASFSMAPELASSD